MEFLLSLLHDECLVVGDLPEALLNLYDRLQIKISAPEGLADGLKRMVEEKHQYEA